MGQKPYVRGFFFPKAGVIPSHRASSTGETRTPASSHRSFSYNFGVPASVEGGLVGSARGAGAGDGASPCGHGGDRVCVPVPMQGLHSAGRRCTQCPVMDRSVWGGWNPPQNI